MVKDSESTNAEHVAMLEEPTPDMSIAHSHESLKELIEKNIKWSQVLYHQNKAINRRITFMAIGGYIRLALILIPIILGLIYLPPIINEMLDKYRFIWESSANGQFPVGDFLQQLFDQYSTTNTR